MPQSVRWDRAAAFSGVAFVHARVLALLILAALSACIDARAPSNAPPCSSEAECSKEYRAAVQRLQACLGELKMAGYVGPGGAAPPQCSSMQSEVDGLARAVARFHEKQPESDGGQGFEVPVLPTP